MLARKKVISYPLLLAQNSSRHHSFLLNKQGIVICVNDEYPLKVYPLIEVTDDGIVICVNDKHPSKAFSPMKVTDEGI